MEVIKKVIEHPLFIILLFSGIVISGEQMGGFYLLYILLGLPHFVIHSILGIIGIVCLLYSYYNKKAKIYFLHIIGACFMISSLIYFFLQTEGSYNYNTFHEILPLATLTVFGGCLIFFIYHNAFLLIQHSNKKNKNFIS